MGLMGLHNVTSWFVSANGVYIVYERIPRELVPELSVFQESQRWCPVQSLVRVTEVYFFHFLHFKNYETQATLAAPEKQ